MKNKQLKTKTYVDNPPIKETTTQTSFQMRFSKSNFMFIGKWIIAFVLVVVFGSQALNGFISSKFTKDSTTETIVHEYKKEIGTEVVGGNFDSITSFQDLNGKKLYLKNLGSINSTYDSDYLNIRFRSTLQFFNSNDELVYKNEYDYHYIRHILQNGMTDDYAFSSSQNYQYSYFYLRFVPQKIYLNNNQFNYSYCVINYPSNITYYTGDLSSLIKFLNYYFVLDAYEKPIYETTTYIYEVKDNNYNWDLKLKQLSAFKPLFKFNQSFINDDYAKYHNLISYEYVDTTAGQQEVINRYKEDERLKPLFDNNYIGIGGKSESGLFKDKTKMYSFIEFNFPIDYDIQGVSSAYNWALENYVTDFNIDSYLKESKYKVELKDILEIFKFPIQIVNNLVYDFGVLIGFITYW